jgi:subtilisin
MLPFWLPSWWCLVLAAAALVKGQRRPEVKIVVFRSEVAPEEYGELLAAFGGRLVKTVPLADAAVGYFPPGKQTLKLLAEHPKVEAVEDDLPVAVCGAPAAEEEEIPWGVSRVEAPPAWEAATGAGVKVGIIDTGVDLNHPDLKPNLRAGVNLLRPGRPPQDDNGHGTHVAGILAAARNRRGVVGVAPGAELYVVKAFDSTGNGRLSSILEGLDWCAGRGVRVVNLSFGMLHDSLALKRAVEKAYAAGVFLVAAAGNLGRADSVTVPGRYPQVVAVSALTREGGLAPFSSFGPEVDVIAPGENILSTYPGGYRTLSGTSMAAPHVSGVAALALELEPRLTPAALRQLLRSRCRPVPGLAREQQGAGVPSALELVRTLRGRIWAQAS